MSIDKQLLKGSIKVIVLQILSTTPCHGYLISEKIKKVTFNEITVSEGTLYPLLHSLKADGYLTSELQATGDRKRKIYSLTKKGEELLNEKKSEWKNFSSVIDGLLASFKIEKFI